MTIRKILISSVSQNVDTYFRHLETSKTQKMARSTTNVYELESLKSNNSRSKDAGLVTENYLWSTRAPIIPSP